MPQHRQEKPSVCSKEDPTHASLLSCLPRGLAQQAWPSWEAGVCWSGGTFRGHTTPGVQPLHVRVSTALPRSTASLLRGPLQDLPALHEGADLFCFSEFVSLKSLSPMLRQLQNQHNSQCARYSEKHCPKEKVKCFQPSKIERFTNLKCHCMPKIAPYDVFLV